MNNQKLLIDDFEIQFPYQPYPQQKQYMQKILSTLKFRSNCLMESPTGTEWIRRTYPNYRIQHQQKYFPFLMDRSDLPIKKKSQTELPWEIINDATLGTTEQNLLDNITKLLNQNKEKEANIEIKKLFNSCCGFNWYPRIFYGTRTHSQIKQIVRELKKIDVSVKLTILGSKERYCINEFAKGNSIQLRRPIDEMCKQLRDEGQCKYHTKYGKRNTGFKELYDNNLPPVYDIEDLKKCGSNCNFCPYFLSTDLIGAAELVVCPYQYIVDPKVNTAKDYLPNSIIIFDEGHNIEDVCRGALSSKFILSDLKACLNEFKILIEQKVEVDTHKKLRKFLKRFLRYMNNVVLEKGNKNRRSNKTFPFDMVKDLILNCKLDKEKRMKKRYKKMELVLKTANSTELKKTRPNIHFLSVRSQIVLESILIPLKMMILNEQKYREHYYIVITEIEIRGETEKQCEFLAMNPGMAIENLKDTCFSIILTSGTLSPMFSFSSELDMQFKEIYEGGHVIDVRNQVLVCGVGVSKNLGVKFNGTYSNIQKNGVKYFEALGRTILEYSKIIPFGILVFFPSYSFLNNVTQAWDQKGIMDRISRYKKVFSEPRKRSKANFKEIIKNYRMCIKNCEKKKHNLGVTGAIFLSVSRGKLSEGIDFPNNQSRAVIIVSIPYPNVFDAAIKLKKSWNDRSIFNGTNKSLLKGNKWYSLQAWRSVNQSIGRCIRNKNDFGSIILIDERYNPTNIRNLPKWIQYGFKNCFFVKESINQLKKFFSSPLIQRLKEQGSNVKSNESVKNNFNNQPKVSPYFSNPITNQNYNEKPIIRNEQFKNTGFLPASEYRKPVNQFNNRENIQPVGKQVNQIQYTNRPNNVQPVKQDNRFLKNQFVPSQYNPEVVPIVPPNRIFSKNEQIFGNNQPKVEQFQPNKVFINNQQKMNENTRKPTNGKMFKNYFQFNMERNKKKVTNMMNPVQRQMNQFNQPPPQFNDKSFQQGQNIQKPRVVRKFLPPMNISGGENQNLKQNDEFKQYPPFQVKVEKNNFLAIPKDHKIPFPSNFCENQPQEMKNYGNKLQNNNRRAFTISPMRQQSQQNQKFSPIKDNLTQVFHPSGSYVEEDNESTQVQNYKDFHDKFVYTPKKKEKVFPNFQNQKTILHYKSTNCVSCGNCGNLLVKEEDFGFLDSKLITVPDDLPYLSNLTKLLYQNNTVRMITKKNRSFIEDGLTDNFVVDKEFIGVNNRIKTKNNVLHLSNLIRIPIPEEIQNKSNVKLFAPNDGLVYKLLFCAHCAEMCVGVEVILSEERNIDKIGQILMFKHSNRKKRKLNIENSNNIEKKKKKLF